MNRIDLAQIFQLIIYLIQHNTSDARNTHKCTTKIDTTNKRTAIHNELPKILIRDDNTEQTKKIIAHINVLITISRINIANFTSTNNKITVIYQQK